MFNPFKLQHIQELEDEQFKTVLLHTKEIYLTVEHIPTSIHMLNSWILPLHYEEQTEKVKNNIKALQLRIGSYEKLLTDLKNGKKLNTYQNSFENSENK